MTTTINIQTDNELQTKAQAVLDDLGLDISTAFNMFLKQVIYKQAIPFEVTKPTSIKPSPFEYPDSYDHSLTKEERRARLISLCGSIDDPTFVEPPEIPWDYDTPIEKVI
ncbi:MAG: type II toxin-antitoxin system RelB/DinJ family antitoxin [Chitinispirillales bacterium]|jgi:addiction module RelB/DinJ family antitoxin|nr:type II toxin-antitoxin system RelB/DinJ family antitoxin [Chitinispirillales bacterium]